MAKPSDKQPAPQASEAPKTDAPTTETKKVEPSLTPEQRAEIVARKQAHGVLGKAWVCKAGTDIPQRFDKAEFSQYESKLGTTVEETVRNMMAFVDGADDLERIKAVQDKFNGAHRLEMQKDGKILMKEPETTNADVQDLLNEGLSGAKRRGTGKPRAEGKMKKLKVEAVATAEDIFADVEKELGVEKANEMRKKYAERLAAIGA